MSDRPRRISQPVEVEATEKWVEGKSEAELLADLRLYLARLRDNPHSLVDRLRVAAIQLRLGRTQEALIHYEGVVRGYVADGQIMTAIALCNRILGLYPQLPRVQRLLTALYARAPHGSTDAPMPVMPVEDSGAKTLPSASDRARISDGGVVMNGLMTDTRRRGRGRLDPGSEPDEDEEDMPTRVKGPTTSSDEVLLLTKKKH